MKRALVNFDGINFGQRVLGNKKRDHTAPGTDFKNSGVVAGVRPDSEQNSICSDPHGTLLVFHAELPEMKSHGYR